MTQAQFASAVGVSTALVQQMEYGLKSITQRTLQKIAKRFREKFIIIIK